MQRGDEGADVRQMGLRKAHLDELGRQHRVGGGEGDAAGEEHNCERADGREAEERPGGAVDGPDGLLCDGRLLALKRAGRRAGRTRGVGVGGGREGSKSVRAGRPSRARGCAEGVCLLEGVAWAEREGACS